MAVDYDLVILGGSSVGRLAALKAAQLRSRVALIEPARSTSPDFLPLFYQQWRQGADLAVARSRAASFTEKRSIAFLATQGVDVCIGQAEFQPPLMVVADGRKFRSRTYLLAPASQPVDRLSIESIAAGHLPTEKITLIGSSPIALELSQILSRSIEVTLYLPRPLAGTDAETFRLLRSYLEAEGVRIETDPPSAQAFSLDQLPQLSSLNLAAAGVEVRSNLIPVNARLQTSNPRIYACGEALGGYELPHLAEVEAQIAIENALFWPRRSIRYAQIPWTIQTTPELAQVGFTERQARRQYGRKVSVVRQRYGSIDRATISGEPIGLCKLILKPDGKILGAHLFGANASETIVPIALALQQNLSIQDLGAIAPHATWGEILSEATQQWQRDRRPNWQRESIERWFDWRR
ncbi:NAD(P)/FAD-dependent oxidoreductase [Microcoleus sp. FACHB-1515]|uniref:FAD-dependent oxidoreductase n=1 Tax=Cyanophyceae TaxID=3028117 RepID=UPI001686AF09|nr:NAD(P)/FAD-dependent oxidoreductase [Microcoleus sp. FACHB-1515]MBD2088959.1 NAD(P)/FAD-dependent oxidoreductase [Microcoleus sp. FACHB-1515]